MDKRTIEYKLKKARKNFIKLNRKRTHIDNEINDISRTIKKYLTFLTINNKKC